MGPAPAGDVGLGQHRQLDRGQDEAPLERLHDDVTAGLGSRPCRRRRQAALVASSVASGRRAVAVGAHARPGSRRRSRSRELAAPAASPSPTTGSQPVAVRRGDVGALGRGGDRPRRRVGVGEQPVERQVQARERRARRRRRPRCVGEACAARSASSARMSAARSRRRRGSTSSDLGVGADEVEQHVLAAR